MSEATNPLDPGGRLYSPLDSERPVESPRFIDRKPALQAGAAPAKKNPSLLMPVTASEGLDRVKESLDLLINDLTTLRGQL